MYFMTNGLYKSDVEQYSEDHERDVANMAEQQVYQAVLPPPSTKFAENHPSVHMSDEKNEDDLVGEVVSKLFQSVGEDEFK